MKNIFLDIDDQYLKNIQGSSDKNSFSKLVQVLREKIEAKAFILNKNVSMLQSFLNQLRLSGKLKILNTANFRNSDYYIWKNGEIDILDPQKDFLVSVLNNKEQGVKENIIFTNTIYSNNEFVYLIEDIRNPKNTNSYWTEIEIVKCDSTIDIENWIKKNVGMRKFERKLDDTKHDIHPYLDCASTLEIENKIKDKYKSDLYCSESRAYDLLQTAFGTPDKTELFNYDPKVKLFINFKETYPNTERQVYHGFHRVDRNDFLKEVQKEIQDQLIQLEKSRIRLYKQNQEYKPDESIDKNKQYESKLKEFKDSDKNRLFCGTDRAKDLLLGAIILDNDTLVNYDLKTKLYIEFKKNIGHDSFYGYHVAKTDVYLKGIENTFGTEIKDIVSKISRGPSE